MSDKIKIIALGGLDDSGKDCYVIEINEDIFVIEAGSALPDQNIPGVDLLLCNFDYLIKNKNRIRAYIMTHGHDENMGSMKYSYQFAPAPIYCTKSTQIMLEAGAKRIGLKPNFQFVIVNPSDDITIAGRQIRLFQTCHNASYSFGVAINTDRGNIVYTGDFIIDFTCMEKGYYFDLKKLEKIAETPTFLLMSESKGAGKTGYCSPIHLLAPKVYKYFKDYKKRIFITCFWQNFYRINEICKLIRQYNKKVYFYNDFTTYVMGLLMTADDSLCLSRADILAKEDLLRVRNDEVVILNLGRGEKLYQEMQKLVYKTNEDKRIVLGKDDIFINAAIPTPTLETLATQSADCLFRSECDVCLIKPKEIASMHARQDDIKFFLSFLKPQYYLPVRGSFVNLMNNAKLALSMNIGLNYSNVFILDNGMELVFDIGVRPTIIPNEINKIDVSPIIADGFSVSNDASIVISERKKLGTGGAVIIAATVSLSKKKIIAGPDCQMRGFVYVKEAEPLLKSVTQIFIEELTIALAQEKPDFNMVVENVREKSKRFILRENGREPYILPIVIKHD